VSVYVKALKGSP